MKLRRSIYARPEIVRGQRCAEALLDPGGATKQLPARRYLVLEGGLTAEPAWAVERRRRRPQEHGWASQPAVARRGGQEVRMPAVPSSACPRPRPASGVQCPVSGVQCQRPVSTLACPRDGCPVSG